MSSTTAVTLANGVRMPLLGLGTYRIQSANEINAVVKAAIESGYRLIDSAAVYRNEEHIGQVINQLLADESLGLKREDLFITSKLAPRDQGYDECYNAVLNSLQRFKLDYIDLFLIHWPGTQKLKQHDPRNALNRSSSWAALERLHVEGKLRAIGVSNYTSTHLTELLAGCTIRPHVHQFELHPQLYQRELIGLCERSGVHVQAYSSLGEGKLINGKEVPPALQEVVARYPQRTAAQVLLKWAVQHGWGVIPKSKNPERVKVNGDIFEFQLTEEDMGILDSLSESSSRRFCWDPSYVR